MSTAAVEEERRLAYVGITRAERQLYVTNAVTRAMYGRITSYLPSRFLTEIPPHLMTVHKPAASLSRTGTGNRDTFSVAGTQRVSILSKPITTHLPKKNVVTTDFHVGDTVQHRLWGKGEVVAVIGEGEGMQLKIQFPSQGLRQVVVKYAPLEKV